ncbi:hypothetical protein [Brevundimonas sp.]
MMTSSILLPWLALGLLAGVPSDVPIAPDAVVALQPRQASQDRLDLSDLWVTYGDSESRALSNIDAQGRSVMFICAPGGQFLVAHSLLTIDQTSVTLASEDQHSIHSVVSEGGDTEDGERRFMFATLSLSEPVILAFRETGRIEVTAKGETALATVNADMKPTVEAFFNSCEGR